jgi:hypothetical protein
VEFGLVCNTPPSDTVASEAEMLRLVLLLFQKSLKTTPAKSIPPVKAPVAKKDAPVVMLIVNGVSPVPPDTFRTI